MGKQEDGGRLISRRREFRPWQECVSTWTSPCAMCSQSPTASIQSYSVRLCLCRPNGFPRFPETSLFQEDRQSRCEYTSLRLRFQLAITSCVSFPAHQSDKRIHFKPRARALKIAKLFVAGNTASYSRVLFPVLLTCAWKTFFQSMISSVCCSGKSCKCTTLGSRV